MSLVPKKESFTRPTRLGGLTPPDRRRSIEAMNRAAIPGLLVLAGACCAAEPPPAPVTTATKPTMSAPALPAPTPGGARTAQAVFADAVKATGGVAAWDAHKNAHFKIETVFQGMGMGGTGDRYATRDDKSMSVTEMTGLGTIREGSNGKVFWSQDPVQGLRLLEGAEAEQARVEACWNPELRAAELFQKLEVATEPGPGGKPLECVIATPKLGAPIHNCYDPATHLQVLQTGIRATPQGDVPFRAVMRDWREVGGIKIAFEAESQVGPLTLVVRIKNVTFDEALDDKIFEPPAVAK
jgi:hypothetical protein